MKSRSRCRPIRATSSSAIAPIRASTGVAGTSTRSGSAAMARWWLPRGRPTASGKSVTTDKRTHVLTMLACLLLVLVAPLATAASSHAQTSFRTGIEVLLHDRLDLIRGKNVGLITNPTGVNGQLVSDIDLLAKAPGVHLVALFGPEHGIRGSHQAGAHVGTVTDPVTGVPIYSLYGKTRQPTPAMLENVDVLVFDIQAVGSRFYTYLYTMADAMKAAAKADIPILVLEDRKSTR